jgi:transcriptional regulator with PAS, ATPase and Fis domain
VKRFVVVSSSEPTRRDVVAQLEDLFDHAFEIESLTVGPGYRGRIRNALVLATSTLTLEDCQASIDKSCVVLIANRTLNFAHLDKLYPVPENSSLLIVNDARQTADEVLDLLKMIGFTQYRFQTWYPGSPPVTGPVDYVITPGETSLVPGRFPNVIDIGPRVLDLTTIIELLKLLEMHGPPADRKVNRISARYLRQIITLGKELHSKHENLKSLNEFLLEIINSVNDGIIVFEPGGTIQLINSIAARLLNLGEGANLLEECGARHRKLAAFLGGDAAESCIHQLDDATCLFTKKYSESTHGFLLTIKNVRERINMENRLRSELKKQGYRARYTFGDMVHHSRAMADLIARSRKLAESDFSILIHGESGTGKEILAGAIHNASRRRDGPFLAVNFSALPDDLIESELFGYEEGAFTGAKRGGKVGLFELANQGTLFLDEIGDISPKIQSRLLRVLQEREILKVGGVKNIPVDVRVVAATNKDLPDMVRKSSFREDLYYRIKKLYVSIPPLRERKEDIRPLLAHFLVQKNGFELKATEDVQALLEAYDWPGNVRELENLVEYVLSLCEGDTIDRSVLPEDLLRVARSPAEPPDGRVLFVLKTIGRFNEDNLLIGRKTLSGLSRDAHFDFSEQQVRTILGGLATRGLVRMGRGKVGLRLTLSGRELLMGNGR